MLARDWLLVCSSKSCSTVAGYITIMMMSSSNSGSKPQAITASSRSSSRSSMRKLTAEESSLPCEYTFIVYAWESDRAGPFARAPESQVLVYSTTTEQYVKESKYHEESETITLRADLQLLSSSVDFFFFIEGLPEVALNDLAHAGKYCDQQPASGEACMCSS